MQTLSRRGEHPARANRPRPAPRGETSNSGPSATGRGHRSLGVEPRFRQVYVHFCEAGNKSKEEGEENEGHSEEKRNNFTTSQNRTPSG